MNEHWKLTIGLEIHVQLNTRSKAFCADPVLFGAPPNTLVSPISLGHPGTMPVVNEAFVERAVKLGLALGCSIRERSFFDRKNYFYPDLPKGYQITQDRAPICMGGKIPFFDPDGTLGFVALNRIHMEEDAGKSLHLEGEESTSVDLNRAGVPLLEIVTEPDLHRPEDAAACLVELRKIIRFLGIGDGNMEEGSFRCDANVSVRKAESDPLGSRVEIKNMNSFRHVRQSIAHEFERQVALLESGGTVVSETRTFDPETGKTYGMRNKEAQHDYRYFPEPDMGIIEVSPATIARIRDTLGALPYELFLHFHHKLGLPATEARFLSESPTWSDWLLTLVSMGIPARQACSWLLTPIQTFLREHQREAEEVTLNLFQLAEIIRGVEEGAWSYSQGVQVLLPVILDDPRIEIRKYALAKGFGGQVDEDQMKQVVASVLAGLPEEVLAYRKGKKNLLGMFMGEVRKKGDPAWDPRKLSEWVKAILEESRV